MSSVSGILHFGLGPLKIIDSIIVRWPDLAEQRLTDVTADTLITFEYNKAVKSAKRKDKKEETQKLFSAAVIPGLEFRHIEDAYVDFFREKLIPHSLSAEGPALAAGDVNGDGLDDIFIGGAKGQAARILFSRKREPSNLCTFLFSLLNSKRKMLMLLSLMPMVTKISIFTLSGVVMSYLQAVRCCPIFC